jgi:hypothetical protein
MPKVCQGCGPLVKPQPEFITPNDINGLGLTRLKEELVSLGVLRTPKLTNNTSELRYFFGY